MSVRSLVCRHPHSLAPRPIPGSFVSAATQSDSRRRFPRPPFFPFSRTMAITQQNGPEAAHKLLDFVNASPTPFHAVQVASARLERAGFQKIREQDDWDKDLKAGGKYYLTRNQSALLAFTLPQKWQPGAGVSIVATHVDSPNLRVRPISKRSKAGYLQVGVETYGSGSWHSWFDRDLSLAGRVVITDKSGDFHAKIIRIDRPILRIPSLAIHLDRGSADNFRFNAETEFVPIVGIIESNLNSLSSGTKAEEPSKNASSIQDNHHPALLALLADHLSVAPESIHDFELHLYDTQPSVLGGLNNEFVFSPRMDNQFSSFAAVEAIATFALSSSFNVLEGNVNCIALFNHEEIGSVSTSGAESSLIPFLLQRLSPSPAAYAQSVARSFLISADMTHAVHPNYTGKYEDNHTPLINGGVTIKTNAKQRYATDSLGSFVVKKLIERKGGKVQEYEVRNDMVCGSTVGPMLSKLGIRTVDVGCPMLSMHSIRETAGSHDVQAAIDLFISFFEGFADLHRSLNFE
ncbi:aspartyl aminopeptidase [Trametes punicea]|nr:aspartyl aminopeptidase [Trametes punicea]